MEVQLHEYLIPEEVKKNNFLIGQDEKFTIFLFRLYGLHNLKYNDKQLTLWVKENEVELEFDATHKGWGKLNQESMRKVIPEYLKPGHSILLERYDSHAGIWLFSGNVIPSPVSTSSNPSISSYHGTQHGMSDHRGGSNDMASIHLEQERHAQMIRDREEEDYQKAIALSLQDASVLDGGSMIDDEDDELREHLLPGYNSHAAAIGAGGTSHQNSRKQKTRDFLSERDDMQADRPPTMHHGAPETANPEKRQAVEKKVTQIEIIDINLDSLYLDDEEAKEALAFKAITYHNVNEYEDDFYDDSYQALPLTHGQSDGEDADSAEGSGEGCGFGCS